MGLDTVVMVAKIRQTLVEKAAARRGVVMRNHRSGCLPQLPSNARLAGKG